MNKLKLIFLSFLLSFQLSAFDEFLVSDIRIIGLQRVSTGSIFNVIPISVGDKIDIRKSNDIVRSLFSTEQFDDIQIGKDGNTLIITVIERPSISAIEISGNKALKTEQLLESLDGVGIKEGEVYKRSTLEKVKSELIRSYASNGRYGANVEIIESPKPRNRLEIDIEVDEKDLRIDTYRASGAGGQHVNKTDSAIRITHLPTNTVVQCQNDRSQHRNKAQAMSMLKAKLYEIELKRREEVNNKNTNNKGEIGWGSQIRSYVLPPYQMVKDLRTNIEVGNTQSVLDGDIDVFVESALAYKVGMKR